MRSETLRSGMPTPPIIILQEKEEKKNRELFEEFVCMGRKRHCRGPPPLLQYL